MEPRKKAKTYYTHNNGGRPFKVKIHDDTMSIYRMTEYDPEWKYEDTPYLSIPLEGKKVFIPKPHPKTPSHYQRPTKHFRGNSILLQVDPHTYLYVGGKYVYMFETKDEILRYYSPVGNSDVPYPWAVGTQNVYLMIENGVMPKNEITDHGMPYNDYYEKYNGINTEGPDPKYRVRTILDVDMEKTNMVAKPKKRCYRYCRSGNRCQYYYPNELSADILDKLK